MKTIFRAINKTINYFFDFFIFLNDLLFFKWIKKNSPRSYSCMLRLFYLTGGISNDIINFFSSKKPLTNSCKEGLLSKYDAKTLFKYQEILKNNGYVILDDVLTTDQVDDFVKDFKEIEGFYISDKEAKSKKQKLEIKNPKSVKFYYLSQDIINNKLFQKILFDTSFINFAQLYLKSYPVIDNISSWWSFPTASPDKNAAQWWHFDLERPKWLKFFFFLTDCETHNGAHCFVKGSHKNNGIKWQLRKKGYERLTDEEVNKLYSNQDIVEITAKKGSLLIEDTRGLHKGKNLIKDHRFLIQVQYSSSTFGTAISDFQFPQLVSKKSLEVKNKFSHTYSLFR
jgi:ectoine hydroxylase-related dioxygenase (phytanoyl-CoA dioxygenase family)